MLKKIQKKIRAYLINYVDEELKRKKRKNKKEILINSIPLDILEKKNMQCTSFIIKENNYFYQQNLDIGWVIGVNFDINNSNHQKPLMNLFTNKLTKEIDKVDSSEIGEEKIEIVNKETIIKKNIDRTLYIHHQKDLSSSLGISLFQKREISERKFNKEYNNDYFSGLISNFMSNKNNKEKYKEETRFKDTNSILDDNFFLVKRMSNITLETELSRIIKCCHEEDCSSSQERCASESRRAEMNKELKLARMYAKKLNLYCKKLKKNVDRSYFRKKTIQQKNQIKKVKTNAIKNITKIKNGEINNSKVKSHIIQRIKYRKIIPKRHSAEERQKNPKIKSIEKKKTKTNKASIDSDKNKKLFESSSHAKENMTSRENTNKNKKGVLRPNNQFLKRNSSTFRNKIASKLKQVFFKSPKKVDIFKKKKSKQMDRDYKKLSVMHQRLLNKQSNTKKEDEKTLKIIKNKKRSEHKNEKTSIFRINRKKIIKKSSMVENFDRTGLGEINIFKTKTKSSFIPFKIKPSKKKSKKKKEKANNNNINNNINNKSTSISQRKDTSDSSEILYKDIDKKNNNKYKYNKKHSAYLFKRKNDKYEIENFRSIKKRRLSHFDNIKIHKAKRISPLKTDREKRNHTTEQNEQKFKRIHEFNAGDGEITTDFDDFNQIDEFLYRIKLKRGKNINPMGLD